MKPTPAPAAFALILTVLAAPARAVDLDAAYASLAGLDTGAPVEGMLAEGFGGDGVDAAWAAERAGLSKTVESYGGYGALAAAAEGGDEDARAVLRRYEQKIDEWVPEDASLADLVKAVMLSEWHHRWPDSRQCSGDGACGLMQFMPATWRFIMPGVPLSRRSNDRLSVIAAARYLRSLRQQYYNPRDPNSMTVVVAAYNTGPGNINRFCKKVPPSTWARGETFSYIHDWFIPAWRLITGSRVSTAGHQGARRECDTAGRPVQARR